MIFRAWSRHLLPAVVATLGVWGVAPVVGAQDPSTETPRDLGLVERAVTRLAQIDVTVDGPDEVVESLGPEDFRLKIGFTRIERFFVDRLCSARLEGSDLRIEDRAAAPREDDAASVARPARPSVTYVFYYDQANLTPQGRQRSIDMSRELIPELVAGGSRATIVSNAAELRTLVPMTTSVDDLLAGLARMEDDRRDWDPYAALEENRLAEVAKAAFQDTDAAIHLARHYQMDDRWRAERDLRRLSMVVGRLTAVEPPKAILYFADTMRSNAGEHYLSFFGVTVLMRNPDLEGSMRNDAFTAGLAFDRVLNEAAARDVRFYAVEAQGLASPATFIGSRSSPTSLRSEATPALNLQRIRDAQSTLGALAAETGGRSFLNGVEADKIADRIARDLSCPYVISFDPREFPQDAPLKVSVEVTRPKVRVRARGRLVVPSESSRLTSRLLASFATPEMQNSDVPIRIGVIPVAYREGAYTARVQVALPSSRAVGATWDLGASLVSRGRVREDVSGRVRVNAPGVPVVLEKEMTFGPGPYELVAVAYEATTDRVAMRRLEGAFPDLEDVDAAIAPVSVSQPTRGAFLRNGESKPSGHILGGDAELLQPGLPTALVGLVCRGKDLDGPLLLKRVLIGETETPFASTTLELATGACAQFLDVIPQGVLGAGSYRYLVRVEGPRGEVARAVRRFIAVESAPDSDGDPTTR